jgi:hypothetical protein
MTKSAFSVFVFGIYLAIGGISFILFPNFCLSLLNVPATNEAWIRIMGWCMFFLGVYYLVAARHELTIFIRWTTYTRPTFIIFTIILVMLKMADITLVIFGFIELLGAIWTIMALRSDKASIKPA